MSDTPASETVPQSESVGGPGEVAVAPEAVLQQPIPPDPLAAAVPQPPPAPSPSTVPADPQPPAPSRPQPPAQKRTRGPKSKKTVTDVVPVEVEPWIEDTDVEILVSSLRVDDSVSKGQIRGVTSGTVQDYYEKMIKNPPKGLHRVTVWRTTDEGVSPLAWLLPFPLPLACICNVVCNCAPV